MGASDAVTRPCRSCGNTPSEYAYGGTRGYICQPCYIAQSSANTKRKTEARKIPCPRCGVKKYDPKRGTMCQSCAPKEYITLRQRGAPTYHKPSGYWLVKVPTDDPMASMRNSQGYVRQHRLVMADYIGRPLTPDEIVHHKNHDRSDNSIANLELMGRIDHNRLHTIDRNRSRRVHLDESKVRALRAAGLSGDAIADELGVSSSTVYKFLSAAGLSGRGDSA